MPLQNNINNEDIIAKYLCNDIMDSKIEDLLKNVDLMAFESIIEIIKASEKYLFHNLFENYIYELRDGLSNNLFIENLDNLKDNIAIELFDPFNQKDILLIIIKSKNPLMKKLMNIIGIDFKKFKDNSFLCLYFEKHDNKWTLPYKTIILKEDGSHEEIKIFNKPKEINNHIESKDSFNYFLEGLLDLFKSAIKIFNKDSEYIYIPPVYKNKNNKGYYYKMNQVFLREPKKNIKTDQGVAMKIKSKYRNNHQNKIKSESNNFIGN